MEIKNKTLINDYSFSEVSHEEFSPFFWENRPKVFGENSMLTFEKTLSAAEKEKQMALAKNMAGRQHFYFFIYKNEEIVGWHFGKQIDHEENYMVNTALFEAHRNKGVYQVFLQEMILFLKDKGYQIITSKHHASNNAVLVPKLKAGFVIKGLNIDLNFGTMVTLQYIVNELGKSIYNYRTGSHPLPPDSQ
jgi:L-amino acid N-acyltransferase YncA